MHIYHKKKNLPRTFMYSLFVLYWTKPMPENLFFCFVCVLFIFVLKICWYWSSCLKVLQKYFGKIFIDYFLLRGDFPIFMYVSLCSYLNRLRMTDVFRKRILHGTSKTSHRNGSIENFEFYGAKGCSINKLGGETNLAFPIVNLHKYSLN